jgi:hypothetical protein
MNITDFMQPIKLLKGSHADTGVTGQGCFMNVVAYLNGEDQITDRSPCVCVTVRPIAIWLNDRLDDASRARMVPFIERALGSATSDKTETARRVGLVVQLASRCADIARRAADAADAADARYAVAADAAVAATAVAAADAAAVAGDVFLKEEIYEACFSFLDDALPHAHLAASPEVIFRAETLRNLVTA